MFDYADHLAHLLITHSALAAELASIRTLEKLLGWLTRRGLDFAALDLVTQDEYSHDLLVPVGGEWLAFGMT
jgi:hypothetical protein